MLELHLKERYNVTPEGNILAAAIRNRDVAQVQSLLEARPEIVMPPTTAPISLSTCRHDTADRTHRLPAGPRGADINAARPDGIRPIHLTNGDHHHRGWRDFQLLHSNCTRS